MNYYNENDPTAAAWLRQLISQGDLPAGEVDQRSIEDVTPAELKPFKQCHFFAGIGGWSYALQLAGWPSDEPVWTGSCPCQPFSAAGKRVGTADQRHLWPAFFWLIQQCRPAVIFGEQVASKDGLGWWDIVASDLEAAQYTCGAVDLCAAGIGAPHIRQRLYWVGQLDDTTSQGLQERVCRAMAGEQARAIGQRSSDAGSLADAGGQGLEVERQQQARGQCQTFERSGPTNGHWRHPDWLLCADGKARPTQPGIFPLVNGVPADMVRSGDPGIPANETAEARAMRLRGYGNAIVPQLAAQFIQASMGRKL